MGGIGYGLYQAAVCIALYFVNKQGQNNRYRKSHNLAQKGYPEGIADDICKIKRTEKPLEMFNTYPGAPPYTPAGDKVFKSKLDTVHGNIIEKKNNSQSRQCKEIKLIVADNLS
jgi:hypothetical protein